MALRKKKTLLDQASDYIDQVRPQVESAVASALDAAEEFYENTARPALLDAKEKAGPAIADAREQAGPALADARDKAAPLVAAGAAKAGEAAASAKEAADAKVAQLRGEEEPQKKKGSKLKKLAFFAALAGAAGPDEALSDAADEPQPVTTPDEPAEVIDLETPVEDAPKKK
jgi:hypothetical protein